VLFVLNGLSPRLVVVVVVDLDRPRARKHYAIIRAAECAEKRREPFVKIDRSRRDDDRLLLPSSKASSLIFLFELSRNGECRLVASDVAAGGIDHHRHRGIRIMTR
jgi:hypothetical protein